MDLKEAGWQGVEWISAAQDKQGRPETSGTVEFCELFDWLGNCQLFEDGAEWIYLRPIKSKHHTATRIFRKRAKEVQ